MKHRKLRYAAGWEWHLLNIERTERPHPPGGSFRPAQAGKTSDGDQTDSLAGFKARYPACAEWIAAFPSREDSHIAVSETADGAPLLHGTLVYQAAEDPKDVQSMHYWLTPSMLVTAQTDLRLAIRLQQAPWSDRLERCGNAAEAFSVLLGAVVEIFHAGLEYLGKDLSGLQQRLSRMRKTADRAAHLFEHKYELIRLNHLYLPVREMEHALKEAFMGLLAGLDGYVRLTLKMERVDQQLYRYGEELDTLTSMQEAFALTRQGERWRPLAILVAGLAPAITASSIIGFNYRHAPWLTHPMMLAFVGAVVTLLTVLVVFILWRSASPRSGRKSGRPEQIGQPVRERSGASARSTHGTTTGSSTGGSSPGDGGGLPRRPRRRQSMPT